ncbi:MAG TPA: DUF1549 domain-containing protein, partial [Pirellulales bacterium]|nr:DUF1549 domain-containing protein [Pirellulales bacterium]
MAPAIAADPTIVVPPDREFPALAPATDIESGRSFWAYQRPREWDLPAVDDTRWASVPLDRFILARLEAAGLRPNAMADRATLIRRLYFDLWGLPPETAETKAFENDPSPDSYAALVERLLASPRFGERWGRHWLDVARYAESLTLRGFVLPEAWRYRDYVIESFNRDHPYDGFVREQIAGDLLPAATLEERQRQLVATTFLTLGNTNLEEQDKRQLEMDVVDEQLDVIGKALLGQTITCARCHDHKFDPIPTRDYYALAGILRNVQVLEHANVSKWTEIPLPLPPDEEAVFQSHEAAIAALRKREAHRRESLLAAASSTGAATLRGSVIAAGDLPGIVVDDLRAKKVGDWTESRHTKSFVGQGYVHDRNQGKGERTITFEPELPRNGRYEVRLAYVAGANRARRVPVTVFGADGEQTTLVNMQEPPPLDGHFVSLGEHRFEAAGQSFVLIATEGTEGHVIADAVQFLPRDGSPAAAVAQPTSRPPDPATQFAAEQRREKQFESELEKLRAAAPKRPMVMTVLERPEIKDSAIHLHGSVHALGDVVPRGFLQVVSPSTSTSLPAGQSGRLELAAWLTSPNNPLTARVFVNRVWHWLFGQGLVRTVDTFGTTGEPPSHPELLDHLTLQFVERGWSLKQLVRTIVLSQTYQQGSEASQAGLASDPENRLLWRHGRRRLEAECLRDAILSVSGQLRTEIGGSALRAGTATDYGYLDTDTRLSV